MEATRYATLGILGVGGILAAFGLAGTVHAQISDWEYLDIAIDLTEWTRGPYVDGTDLLILTLEVTNNADGMARVDGASVSLRIQDGDDHLRYGRTPWPTGPMAESCPADIRPVGAGLTEAWNVCFLIPEGLEPDFLGIIHSDPDAGHIAQFDSGQDASCLDTYYDILCAPYALDGGVTIPDSCRFDYFAETWTCDDAQGDDIVETAGLRSRADCSRFDALGKASEIAVAEISGRTYAFVAAPFDDGVQVIDVTDPASPVPASSVFDGQDGFDALAGANGVTVAEISSRTYALATATYDGSVQVIDVTDPASPVPASSVIRGPAWGSSVLANPFGATVAEISGRTYALVVGVDGYGIIDLTDPTMPTHVFGNFGYRSVTSPHSWGHFDELGTMRDMAVTGASGRTYALVTSSDYDIHVQDAGKPESARVENHGHDAVYVFDITDPASPVLAARAVDGQGGFGALDHPIGIAVQEISGRTYALVASHGDDAVQIIDVTDPASPVPASSVFDGQDGFDALDGAIDITVAEISGRTYAFVAALDDDAVQIIDVTDPASPVPASSVFDGQGGFDALAEANGVAVAEISGRTYVLVAASDIDGVQVIDVTDPASPVPASSVFYGDAAAAADWDDPAGGGVVVSYRAADDPIHYGLRSWLADNEDVIIDADSVACYLDLPRDVSVVFEACGEANAWYSSATGDITMCYELADRYTEIFRQFSSDSTPLAVAGSLHWVFMHELGHAVIDAYDLPITGQEEDSADQFAAMMLLEEGRWGAGALLSAAYVYGSTPGYTPYWDTHSLNYQRHYDMLCLLYGKHHDNEIGWQAADLIPESRAARCPGEYLDAVNAWNALLPAADNSR